MLTQESGEHSSPRAVLEPIPLEPARPAQPITPLQHSYKLRNDASLENGSLDEVISRTQNFTEYNPILAHYLAYCCSLLNDELTSPTKAVKERLHWTEDAEYHALDNTLLPRMLLMNVGTSIVVVLASALSYDAVHDHFGRSAITSTRDIPYRFSIAEDYREDLRKDTGARFSVPRSGEEEPLTGPTHKGKIEAHEETLFTSRLLMNEIRAFCTRNIGQPMQFLDAVRFANKDVQPNDGLSKYQTPRPRIILTGHGVGGALAQMCSMYISSLYGRDMVCCYTFGQPRIGNSEFCTLYSRCCGSLFRVVNIGDPIARMPRKSPGFKHPKNTRVQYSYPPLLGREGYEHNMAIETSKAKRSLGTIKGMVKKLKRDSNMGLRAHTNYVGITLPMKALYNDPYSFVIHRYIDTNPPQSIPMRGEAPKRAELDLSMENIPFDIFLRDVEEWDKTSTRRRLLVYTGIRQHSLSQYTNSNTYNTDENYPRYNEMNHYNTSYDGNNNWSDTPEYHIRENNSIKNEKTTAAMMNGSTNNSINSNSGYNIDNSNAWSTTQNTNNNGITTTTSTTTTTTTTTNPEAWQQKIYPESTRINPPPDSITSAIPGKQGTTSAMNGVGREGVPGASSGIGN